MIPNRHQAKKITTSNDIKKAYNWLLNKHDSHGAEPSQASMCVDFYQDKRAPISKNDINGEKAISFVTTNFRYFGSMDKVGLPPAFDTNNITVHITFFIDKFQFIEIESFDFSDLIVSSEDVNDPLDFVPLTALFQTAVNLHKSIPANDTSYYTLVKKGKSEYKVSKLDKDKYIIRKADNNQNIKPDSPHGIAIIKRYEKQKEHN